MGHFKSVPREPQDRIDGASLQATLLGSAPVAVIHFFFVEHYVAELTVGSLKN